MIYSIRQLVKKKYFGLKSYETVMKYIKSGQLKAKNMKSKSSRYDRWVISDEDLSNFYKILE